MQRKILIPILIIILIIIGITGVTFGIIFNTPDEDIAIIEESDIPSSEPPYDFDYSWTDHPYIAHAFGGILGTSYTNSYEAFLLNYQLGHRVFETDFSITDDGKTVLAHDSNHWHNNTTIKTGGVSGGESNSNPEAFTYNNFMSSLWYNQFHSLDLTLLFQIMQDYPDIYIVTDTKPLDEASTRLQFNEFLATARKIDESILDRMIIQIYKPEMLTWIMDIYPWKSVIYTLYADPNWTPDNVLEFSKISGVRFVTIPGAYLSKETATLWNSANLTIGVHTFNDLSSVEDIRSTGADIIYTDFLLP